MSNVFEGILCRTSPDNLQRVMSNMGLMASLSLAVATLDEQIAVVFRDDPRSEAAFTEGMNELAEILSTLLDDALLVRYDDSVSYQSSMYYAQGTLQSTYGEKDEIWVLLDDEGYPLVLGQRFRTDELDPDPDVEYETIENAIQLGLKDFGAGDWKSLHRFMTART